MLLYASSHNPPQRCSPGSLHRCRIVVSPQPCLGFVLPRLTLKCENIGLPTNDCCPRSPWSVDAGLLICPAAAAPLPFDQVSMPSSAAVPYCIREPLSLPGPQPLCPSVLTSHLSTAGNRHARINQAMYPPVALCRLGHQRHLQGFFLSFFKLGLGSDLYLHPSTCSRD